MHRCGSECYRGMLFILAKKKESMGTREPVWWPSLCKLTETLSTNCFHFHSQVGSKVFDERESKEILGSEKQDDVTKSFN